MTATITYAAQEQNVSVTEFQLLVEEISLGTHDEATTKWRKSDGEVHVSLVEAAVATDQIEEVIADLDAFLSSLSLSLPDADENTQVSL